MNIRRTLRDVSARNRLVVAILGAIVGASTILVAFYNLQDAAQASIAAIGSAVLGASGLALVNYFALTHEIQEVLHKTDLKEALRGAFQQSNNLREDGLALGVVRIFGRLGDLQRYQPLEELVKGAQTVYFLGTSLSTTTLRSAFIRQNSNAQFRFVFVSLPKDNEGPLEQALSIIHNLPIKAKLQATQHDFAAMRQNFSNVEYKTIQFVPPFSAILALGEDEAGNEWGRMQVDAYSLRTIPDSRLWLILEGPGSLLFDRYRTLIEHIWSNPEEYDIRTAKFKTE